jgi:hypothetical protein
MLKLGEYSYGSATVKAWNRTSDIVHVGKFCSLADGITIFIDGNHRIDRFSSFPFNEIFGWQEVPKMHGVRKHPVLVMMSGLDQGQLFIPACQSVMVLL